MLEKLFKLKEHNTNVKTEIIAGITTFMTMAYILVVNPQILSEAGMDATAVMLATCISSFIGCVCMAFMANMPFVLSAGMGLNAYFTYSIVQNMGVSWQMALFAVFVEGLIFIVLSLTKVREAIFNAIPLQLKNAVSVGVGIYIAFIGMQGANLVVNSDNTLVTIINFSKDNITTEGICAILALIGTLLTAFLYIKNVKGSILIGILATWGMGMLCQLIGWYEGPSLYPTFALPDFSSLGETFGQCFTLDFGSVNIFEYIIVIMSFLFVDIFDTLGTVIGVSAKAKMLDEQGRLPKINRVLLADAVATTAGAVFGTSTVTTFVESSTGVEAGGRTGLTTLTAGVLFLIAMLFSNIFTVIPGFATAPALIIVGFLMFTNIINIKLDDDYATVIPAYLCIASMPLFYSISEGLTIGIISYVVLNLVTGKAKKISPIMYVLAVLFILKYIFL